jgi:hypothetical protein
LHLVSRIRCPPAHCGYLNETPSALATKISLLYPLSNLFVVVRVQARAFFFFEDSTHAPVACGIFPARISSFALICVAQALPVLCPTAWGSRLSSVLNYAAHSPMPHPPLREPRWPAFIAMLAAAGIYLALPEPLTLGPSWFLLVIIVFLMIPIVISDRRGDHKVTRILSFTANGIITIALIAALIHLVQGIPQHLETPKGLLRSALTLWIANILIFALWYWKLDGGGPLHRERPGGLAKTSFLFPQMMGRENEDPSWTPHFIDYLFLAFNTSTAFSPTDTAVLSRGAKLGTMLQSLISLTIIALLAARAVNIL